MKSGFLVRLIDKETILLTDTDYDWEMYTSAGACFIQGYGIEDYNPFMTFSKRDISELYINMNNILYVKLIKYELK